MWLASDFSFLIMHIYLLSHAPMSFLQSLSEAELSKGALKFHRGSVQFMRGNPQLRGLIGQEEDLPLPDDQDYTVQP